MYSNGIISIKYTIGIIKLIKVFNASSSLYSCIPIFIVSYSIQNPATARTISSNLCTFSYSSSRSAITFIITIIVVIGIITNSTHMLKVNVLIINSKTIVNFKLSFKTFLIYSSSASFETAFMQYIKPEKTNQTIISLIKALSQNGN